MKKSKPTRTVPADAYTPASGYLMLKPEYEFEGGKSEGGIFIPDQAVKLLNEAEVLKVGADVPAEYKPGMFVVFEPASEHVLEIEKGVRVLVVHVNNITMYRNALTPLFPRFNPTAP